MPADLLLSVVLFAAQAATQPASPDPALLEFLGSFQTEEGEWVDPMVLAEVDVEAVEQQTEEAITPDNSEASEQARNASQSVEDGGEQP